MIKTQVFVIACAFILICSGILTGCAVNAENPDAPFYQDRVTEVRIVMDEEDWAFCMEHPFEEAYVPADFWFDGQRYPDVGVRTKGNSSLGQAVGWDSPRLPFAVDFNLFNKARTFYGLKKVFLNNGWSDPTLIREVITYKLFEDFGLPSPRATLVDVWVNDIHTGVYTMVEMIDQTFIDRHFADGTGNLYKPELVAARLDWTEEDAYKKLNVFGMGDTGAVQQDESLYVNIGGGRLIDILRTLDRQDSVAAYQPSPDVEGSKARGLPPAVMPENLIEAMMLKTNEANPDHTGLFTFLEVLNNEPDETFPEKIKEVVDIELTLKFIAASAVTVHLDNYIGIGHNAYFYEVDGVVTPLVWDTNMTFGTFNMGIRKDGLVNYYIDEPTTVPMDRLPLVGRLLEHQEFLEQYRGYVREFMEGPFDLEQVLARVDAWHDIVRPYAEADTGMFYSYEDWERCFTEDLRPPDLFPGWMAGGPSPNLPFFLSGTESAALKKEFGVRSLWELMNYAFTPEKLEVLENCLEQENYDLFLQNLYGPLMAPQPPRQPGFGPNSLGLKTFITARYRSVWEQLNGERPGGSGRGAGNGGSTWMIDMFRIP